jgi:hypothetical protein
MLCRLLPIRSVGRLILHIGFIVGVLVAGLSNHSASAAVRKPIRWLLAPQGLEAIAADAEVSSLLDNTQPFVRRGLNAVAIPPRWNAIPFDTFTSFGAIKVALEQSMLVPGVEGIMYDNESWRFTPVKEQQNPAYYERLAADLVHSYGLLFIAAPAVDLVPVLAPGTRGSRYDTYLQLGIAADAARHADVIDIQAQGVELNTGAYENFVRQAAAQARGANPRVLVLAGVSTNPSGQKVTTDAILRAITATRDIVDGYWLNIPQPGEKCPRCNEFRPDIAIEVLSRLSAP